MLRRLAPLLRVRVPDVLFESKDVLVIEHVPGRGATGRERGFAQAIWAMWQAVSIIWSSQPLDPREVAATNLNRRRSIEATFARKFSDERRVQYIDQLTTGTRSRQALLALVESVEWGPRPSGVRLGLVYGDLKPEHLLLDPVGEAAAMIDPAIRMGDPTEDVARFMMRSLLSKDSLRGPLLDAGETKARSLPVRRLTHLLAADWANILTTRLNADSGRGQRRPLDNGEVDLCLRMANLHREPNPFSSLRNAI